MWHHYAGSYTGAVLELACDDTLDSAWLAAQPVTYPADKPAVYTLEGWGELLTLKHELAVERMLHVSTFTKAPDWAYEREWRILTFKRPTDTGHFTDYPFNPREVVTVFLGPLMSSDDKARLNAMVAQYPLAKVVEVSFGVSREFLFNEVRG